MNIEGLRIVITGAGAGLGRALALALGRRGARVALVARTAGALEAVAADTECEALERALSVNVLGPFRLTRALLGPMRLGGDALVLMVSSDAAVEAYPTWGAYGASKAALDHLARIWSAELDGHGVRVMTVDPGEMDTAMHADAMPDADRASLASPSDVAERFVEIIRHAGSIPPGQRVAAQGFSAGEPS